MIPKVIITVLLLQTAASALYARRALADVLHANVRCARSQVK